MDAALLAASFGLGRVVRLSDGPVARGREGEVWSLETVDGRWAAKRSFASTSDDEVRDATGFQEAAYRAGVPTPQVRRTVEGRIFAEFGSDQVRMYEWVDLLEPDVGLDPELVGDLTARTHRVPIHDFGTFSPWYHAPVGAEYWDLLVARLTDAGAPFAGRLAALRDELVALESWLELPATLRTCHRDLWADNVRATRGGGVCVIDWENSGPADPSHELACVLFEFARGDAGRARALRGAYCAAGGPGEVTRRGHFSMLIAQLGHITRTAAGDWLEPNRRSPDRGDAEAWISEVLDEPHTRDLLETLLAG